MTLRRTLVIVLMLALILGSALSASAQEKTHTVQPGETLGSIARLYGVTIEQLAFANGIANPNLIFAGQVLRIPGTAPAGGKISYTVQAGDTLFAIALRYGTTVDAIVQLNGLTNPDVLKIGQVLQIPSSAGQATAVPTTPAVTGAPTSMPTPPSTQTITYTVKVGDTLGRIALSFGTTYQEIALLNNLSDPNLIFPGQTLIIKKSGSGTPPTPTATTVIVTLPVSATAVATKTNTPVPPISATPSPKPPTVTPGGLTVTATNTIIPTNTLAPTETPTLEATFPPGFKTPTPIVSGTGVPPAASNLLQNPDFEGESRTVAFDNAIVGQGWEPFYCDQPYTAQKCPALRLGTGNPQGLLMGRPGYGINTTASRIHGGAAAQSWSCPWAACRAGIFQTVDTIPGSTCEAGAFVMSVSANNPTALFSDLITFDDRANSTWVIKVDQQGAPDTAFNAEMLASPGFGYSDGIYDRYAPIKFTFTATGAQTTIFFENLRLWPLTINDSFIDDAYVRCSP